MSSAARPSFIKRVLETGKRFATKHPVITNAITYGTIYTCAELTQQTIIGLEKYDWVRASRFTIIGTAFFGPCGYYWYKWLDGFLPGISKGVLVKKIFIDQMICSAGFLVIFFVVMSILERKPDITAELKQKFVPVFAASCCFWPAAQLINFYFLPTQYRVLYIASLGLVWGNFMCYMKRMGEETPNVTHAKQKAVLE